MAGKLVYHWKHGWIPLTHAAALSKAHGSSRLAEKYVPGASTHHSDLVTRGMSARQVQAKLDPHGRRPSEPDAGAALRISQNAAAHPLNSRVNFREGAGTRLQTGTVVGHSDRGVIVKRDAGGEVVTRLASDLGPVRSPDAGVSRSREHTPERGASAVAALQAAHDARRPVETMKDADLRQQADHPDAARRSAVHAEIERRQAAKAAGSPRRGIADYGTRYDNPTRLQEAAARRARMAAHLERGNAESRAAAERLGMTFPKPTVKSHGLVGEGATVESPVSEARRFGAAANDGERANIRDAQARARAEHGLGVKPQQSELFGAHGEHQADLFDQPAEPAAEVRANVSHSGDGTLLTIDRGDIEARSVAKSLGFKWSSNLGSWYLPRNWTEPTRRQKVSQLQSRLGDPNVHVDDTGRGSTMSAAEREADTRARAADRADRMDNRAQRQSTEAERRFGAADQISSHIPMGQPILVGHHSERRHRRDLERIDTNMRKGVEAHQASKDAAHAADNARRTAAGDDPLKRQRRIDRLEADVRAIDRQLKDHELAGRMQAANPEKYAKVAHVVPRLSDDRLSQLQARRRDLADQIGHDRGQIEAAGFQAPSAGSIEAGDIVHYRGRQHIVSKVNQKTVSVPTGYSWEDKVPINQITKVTKFSALSDGSLKIAANAAKNNPKLRARYIRELERRGIHVGDL